MAIDAFGRPIHSDSGMDIDALRSVIAGLANRDVPPEKLKSARTEEETTAEQDKHKTLVDIHAEMVRMTNLAEQQQQAIEHLEQCIEAHEERKDKKPVGEREPQDFNTIDIGAINVDAALQDAQGTIASQAVLGISIPTPQNIAIPKIQMPNIPSPPKMTPPIMDLSVKAFEKEHKKGPDIVAGMLTPGEGVVPKGNDQLVKDLGGKIVQESGGTPQYFATRGGPNSDIIDALQEMTDAIIQSGSGGGGAGRGGGGRPPFSPGTWGGRGTYMGGGFGPGGHGFDRLTKRMGFVQGGAAMATGIITNDIVDQEYLYLRGMREIAYQTEGVTAQTESLQNTWEKLGKTVKRTGVDRTRFQMAFVANVKKGIKDLKTSQKITEIGLHLGKQIGANAENTSQMFHDWHMRLNLTTGQMQAMSLNAKEVARQTGLTGENLEEVIRSTDAIVTSMRNAGNFTAEATRGIMGMSAAAKKFGVAEPVNKLLDALSSGSKFLTESSAQTKAFLLRSASDIPGMHEQIIMGTVLKTQKAQKELVAGMDREMSRFARGLGVSLDKFSELDLGDLPDEVRFRMSFAAKQMYGMEIGELHQAVKAMKEGSMTFADRMEDFASTRQKQWLTTQEELNLRKKERDATVARTSEILGAYDAAIQKSKEAGLTGAAAIQQAFQRNDLQKMIQGGQEDFRKLFGEIGGMDIDTRDATQVFKAAGTMLMDQIAQDARKAGIGLEIDMKGIEEQLASQDPQKVREGLEKLNAEQRRVATIQEASTDPIKKVQFDLLRVNEQIRQISASMLSSLMGIMGEIGILITLMGAMLLPNIGGVASVMGNMRGFFTGGGHKGAMFGVKGMKSMTRDFGLAISKFGRLIGKGPIGTGVRTVGLGMVQGGTTAAAAGSATGLTTLTGAIGGALGGFAAPAAAVAAAVVGVTAVLGGVVSAFKAGTHAAEMFNVAQKDVTVNQKLAAESAGFLTGILNVLTLGFFRKALGPAGSLTQKLAQLSAAFPPLTWAIQAILLPFKVLWGILKGLGVFVKEVFVGLWEGIKAALMPLVEVWNSFRMTMRELFESFGFFGTKAKDTISIVEAIVGVFRFLGKTVGWALKIIGHAVGWILRVVAIPLQLAIKALGGALKGIMWLIMPIVDGLQVLWKGLSNILQGIGNFDFKQILFGIGKTLEGAVRTIFWGALNLLTRGLLAIPMMIWHAIVAVFNGIPDILQRSVVDPIKKLPILMADKFGQLLQDLGSSLWDAIKWLPEKIGEGLSGIFPDWMKKGWGWLVGTSDEKGASKISLPQYAVGADLITKTGFAQVHAGERIVPAKATGPYKHQGREIAPGQGGPYEQTAGLHMAQTYALARHTKGLRRMTGAFEKTTQTAFQNATQAFRNKDIVRTATNLRTNMWAALSSSKMWEMSLWKIKGLLGDITKKVDTVFSGTAWWQRFFGFFWKGFKGLTGLVGKGFGLLMRPIRALFGARNLDRFLVWLAKLTPKNLLKSFSAGWSALTGGISRRMGEGTWIGRTLNAFKTGWGRVWGFFARGFNDLIKFMEKLPLGIGKITKFFSQPLKVSKFYKGGSFLPKDMWKTVKQAPKGGVTAAGKFYKGGSFLPKDMWKVIKRAPKGGIQGEVAVVRLMDKLKFVFGGLGKAITSLFTRFKDFAKGLPLIGKLVGRVGDGFRLLGPGLKSVGKFIGRIPFLGQIIGGVTGGIEAGKAGTGMFKGKGFMGKLEGILMGVFTGGARKESIWGDFGLVEKHGVADEALGIAGATTIGGLGGAAIGTLLAPLTGGLSIPIAAAIGAIIGFFVQIYKLITSNTSAIKDWFILNFGDVWDGMRDMWQSVKDFWSEISDFFGNMGVNLKGGLKGGLIGMLLAPLTGGLSIPIAIAIGAYWKTIKEELTRVDWHKIWRAFKLLQNVAFTIMKWRWNVFMFVAKTAFRVFKQMFNIGMIFIKVLWARAKVIWDVIVSFVQIIVQIFKTIASVFGAIIGAFSKIGEALGNIWNSFKNNPIGAALDKYVIQPIKWSFKPLTGLVDLWNSLDVDGATAGWDKFKLFMDTIGERSSEQWFGGFDMGDSAIGRFAQSIDEYIIQPLSYFRKRFQWVTQQALFNMKSWPAKAAAYVQDGIQKLVNSFYWLHDTLGDFTNWVKKITPGLSPEHFERLRASPTIKIDAGKLGGEGRLAAIKRQQALVKPVEPRAPASPGGTAWLPGSKTSAKLARSAREWFTMSSEERAKVKAERSAGEVKYIEALAKYNADMRSYVADISGGGQERLAEKQMLLSLGSVLREMDTQGDPIASYDPQTKTVSSLEKLRKDLMEYDQRTKKWVLSTQGEMILERLEKKDARAYNYVMKAMQLSHMKLATQAADREKSEYLEEHGERWSQKKYEKELASSDGEIGLEEAVYRFNKATGKFEWQMSQEGLQKGRAGRDIPLGMAYRSAHGIELGDAAMAGRIMEQGSWEEEGSRLLKSINDRIEKGDTAARARAKRDASAERGYRWEEIQGRMMPSEKLFQEVFQRAAGAIEPQEGYYKDGVYVTKAAAQAKALKDANHWINTLNKIPEFAHLKALVGDPEKDRATIESLQAIAHEGALGKSLIPPEQKALLEQIAGILEVQVGELVELKDGQLQATEGALKHVARLLRDSDLSRVEKEKVMGAAREMGIGGESKGAMLEAIDLERGGRIAPGIREVLDPTMGMLTAAGDKWYTAMRDANKSRAATFTKRQYTEVNKDLQRISKALEGGSHEDIVESITNQWGSVIKSGNEELIRHLGEIIGLEKEALDQAVEQSKKADLMVEAQENMWNKVPQELDVNVANPPVITTRDEVTDQAEALKKDINVDIVRSTEALAGSQETAAWKTFKLEIGAGISEEEATKRLTKKLETIHKLKEQAEARDLQIQRAPGGFGEFAEGGTFRATDPTLAVLGERGAEKVWVAPDKSPTTQAIDATLEGKTEAEGQTPEIKLTPILLAGPEIERNPMEAGNQDAIIRYQRDASLADQQIRKALGDNTTLWRDVGGRLLPTQELLSAMQEAWSSGDVKQEDWAKKQSEAIRLIPEFKDADATLRRARGDIDESRGRWQDVAGRRMPTEQLWQDVWRMQHDPQIPIERDRDKTTRYVAGGKPEDIPEKHWEALAQAAQARRDLEYWTNLIGQMPEYDKESAIEKIRQTGQAQIAHREEKMQQWRDAGLPTDSDAWKNLEESTARMRQTIEMLDRLSPAAETLQQAGEALQDASQDVVGGGQAMSQAADTIPQTVSPQTPAPQTPPATVAPQTPAPQTPPATVAPQTPAPARRKKGRRKDTPDGFPFVAEEGLGPSIPRSPWVDPVVKQEKSVEELTGIYGSEMTQKLLAMRAPSTNPIFIREFEKKTRPEDDLKRIGAGDDYNDLAKFKFAQLTAHVPVDYMEAFFRDIEEKGIDINNASREDFNKYLAAFTAKQRENALAYEDVSDHLGQFDVTSVSQLGALAGGWDGSLAEFGMKHRKDLTEEQKKALSLKQLDAYNEKFSREMGEKLEVILSNPAAYANNIYGTPYETDEGELTVKFTEAQLQNIASLDLEEIQRMQHGGPTDIALQRMDPDAWRAQQEKSNAGLIEGMREYIVRAGGTEAWNKHFAEAGGLEETKGMTFDQLRGFLDKKVKDPFLKAQEENIKAQEEALKLEEQEVLSELRAAEGTGDPAKIEAAAERMREFYRGTQEVPETLAVEDATVRATRATGRRTRTPKPEVPATPSSVETPQPKRKRRGRGRKERSEFEQMKLDAIRQREKEHSNWLQGNENARQTRKAEIEAAREAAAEAARQAEVGKIPDIEIPTIDLPPMETPILPLPSGELPPMEMIPMIELPETPTTITPPLPTPPTTPVIGSTRTVSQPGPITGGVSEAQSQISLGGNRMLPLPEDVSMNDPSAILDYVRNVVDPQRTGMGQEPLDTSDLEDYWRTMGLHPGDIGPAPTDVSSVGTSVSLSEPAEVSVIESNPHEDLRTEFAGEEPPAVIAGGEDMSEIQSNTENLELLPELLGSIRELVDIWKNPLVTQEVTGASGATGPGDTTDKSTGRKPPRYGPMQEAGRGASPQKSHQYTAMLGK